MGGLIGVFLITLAGGWYLGRQWKTILNGQLQQIVINASDSLYQLRYDGLDLNVFTGTARLTNVLFTSDSLVYGQLKSRLLAPDNRFDISVNELTIRGLSISKAAFSKKIDIEEIRVVSPRIVMTNEYQYYNDTVRNDQELTAERLLGKLNSIAVERVGLTDIHFTFNKLQDTIWSSNTFENLNLIIKEVLIDSEAAQDTSRFFYTKSIELLMADFEYEIPDSHYNIGFDSLVVSTKNRSILVQGLDYSPRISRQEFYREMQYAKVMSKLNFEKLLFEQIDLYLFMRTQRIHAAALTIQGGVVDVSNDLRYPRRPTSKIGRSPHQLLLKLDQPLKLDSMFISDVDISYGEIGEKYHREGTITFNRASGWMANVTNDSLSLLDDQFVKADLTAYMMDTGKLNAKFEFDMLDEQGGYTYQGTLGPMNGKPLNRILTPLLNVEVESANIKGISFDMKGTDYRNWGSFRFDYDDMKVGVLETDENGRTTKKKFVSFLANEFLLNQSNPDHNGVYHTASINYRRPHEFSFFKTLWKSLFEGVKQTAGLTKEREDSLMNTAEKAKTISEKAGGILQNLFRKRDREDDQKRDNEVDL